MANLARLCFCSCSVDIIPRCSERANLKEIIGKWGQSLSDPVAVKILLRDE